jgi:hypothetical protein
MSIGVTKDYKIGDTAHFFLFSTVAPHVFEDREGESFAAA